MTGESGAIPKKTRTRPIFRRVAGSKVGPRVSGALGFPVPGGGFLLFGGYLEEGEGSSVRRTATNETWRLSKDLESWERVAAASATPAPAAPRARLAAAGAVASGSAWLLGGWDPGSKGDGGEILSDVWRYDFESGVWGEAKLRQPGEKGKEGERSSTAAASAATTAAAAPSAPFLPPPPETAVALPPGEDPRAFASVVPAAGAAEQEQLPESIVLPSLPACSRAAAAAVVGEGGGGGEARAIALFTHRNGGDILLLDASDVSSPVLRACVVAGDEEAARNRGERAFDGSTALPASRGLSALAAFGSSSSSSSTSAPSSSSSSLHLFGGAPKSGPMLDDSWFLELAPGWEARLLLGGGEENREVEEKGPALRWSRQTSSSSSSSSSNSSSPPPRCSQAVGVLSENSLYLFGGAYYDPAGLLPLGDLWRLDLKSREWEEVVGSASSSSSSPSPRNASAFGVVELPGGKKGLLIHGGWDPFRKTHDDTWLLTEEEEEVE